MAPPLPNRDYPPSWDDDPVFEPVDGPPEPMMTSDLLRDLGVTDAPLDEQRAAVSRWLESHEPNELLRLSLRYDGIAE
jgi:hypothetical protein